MKSYFLLLREDYVSYQPKQYDQTREAVLEFRVIALQES